MIHLSFTCNPQKVHVVGCPKPKGLNRRKLFLEIANKYNCTCKVVERVNVDL